MTFGLLRERIRVCVSEIQTARLMLSFKVTEKRKSTQTFSINGVTLYSMLRSCTCLHDTWSLAFSILEDEKRYGRSTTSSISH